MVNIWLINKNKIIVIEAEKWIANNFGFYPQSRCLDILWELEENLYKYKWKNWKKILKVVLAWGHELKLVSNWNIVMATYSPLLFSVKCNDESDISLVLLLFRKKLLVYIYM